MTNVTKLSITKLDKKLVLKIKSNPSNRRRKAIMKPMLIKKLSNINCNIILIFLLKENKKLNINGIKICSLKSNKYLNQSYNAK